MLCNGCEEVCRCFAPVAFGSLEEACQFFEPIAFHCLEEACRLYDSLEEAVAWLVRWLGRGLSMLCACRLYDRLEEGGCRLNHGALMV
jgi:hypothetical protein